MRNRAEYAYVRFTVVVKFLDVFLVLSIGAAALIKNLVYNIFHGFVLLAITNRIAISSIKDDDRDAEAS